MDDCDFHPYLSPYHDDELEPALRGKVEQHLASCDACTMELAAIHDLSLRVSQLNSSAMQAVELERIHAAVERAAWEKRASLSLARTATLFGALAASILLISGVWLLDVIPPSGPGSAAIGGLARTPAPEWEVVAMTLHADPRPGVADDSPFSPRYASAIDWMLDNLVPTERKPWEKPS